MMEQKNLGVGPFDTQGEALGLRGIKLVVAVVGNFIFGALMSIEEVSEETNDTCSD